MNAHFFDIDTLINVDSNIWIMSKDVPGFAIVKISESEFNLIKKGIYRKFNSPLDINGVRYWFPKDIFEEIKIKSKSSNINITKLTFSMREFLDKDIIDRLEYDINFYNIEHLKNTRDKIYIICSKKSKDSYSNIIDKLNNYLENIGLMVENFYYVSDTFYNRDSDSISNDKVRILVQHLVGLRTDGFKFTNKDIAIYDKIYYYDDDPNSLSLAENINDLFYTILDNTEDIFFYKVKNNILNSRKTLFVRKVNYNTMNLFDEVVVDLRFSNIKKTFNSFNKKI